MKLKKIEEMKKETFDFSEALRRMKEGKKESKKMWVGQFRFLFYW